MKKNILYYLIFLLMNLQFLYSQNSLTGHVANKESGRDLENVNIFIPELQRGTISNDNGNYKITNIPDGSFTAQFSYIGFKTEVRKILINQNINLDIQLDPTNIEINEVVVIGNAVQSQERVPYKIETITKSEAQSDGTVSLVQALSRLPGISELSNGLGISKPVIRGMYGYRIATIINGLRFDNQEWQDEHGLGFDDVGGGNVEIIEGPAALLYGSESMGGVIKIENERNADPGKVLGNYNLEIFSNTLGAKTELGFKRAAKNISWQLHAGGESHADYLDGKEEKIPNTRFAGFSAKGILNYTSSWGISSLNYNFSHHIYGVVEEADLNNPKDKEEDHFEREFEGPHHIVDFHIASLNNTFFTGTSKIKLNLGFQNDHRIEEEGLEEANAGADDELDIFLNTFSYDGEWIHPFSEKTELTIGTQGWFQSYKNEGGRILIPNADTRELSLFAYAKHDLDNLEINGGVRYDLKNIETKETETNDSINLLSADNLYKIFNGALGVTIFATEDLNFKANLATGYRAPNLAELSSNGVHEGTTRFEIGNPEMKSEKNFQIDGGINYRVKDFGFNAGIFYNKVMNYIFLQPTNDFIGQNTIYRFEQEDATLKGGEISLNWTATDFLNFSTSFSAVRGEQDDGSYLPFMPADKIISKVKFILSKYISLENSFFSIGFRNYLKQDRTAAAEIPTPAYTLLDVGLGADIYLFSLKLRTVINATNLLDKKYYDHLSLLKPLGVLDMGRNISLSVSVPFEMN
jgi:iron complex outermembrane recepter protein